MHDKKSGVMLAVLEKICGDMDKRMTSKYAPQPETEEMAMSEDGDDMSDAEQMPATGSDGSPAASAVAAIKNMLAEGEEDEDPRMTGRG